MSPEELEKMSMFFDWTFALTEIGLKLVKTPEEIVNYFLKVIEEFSRRANELLGEIEK